MPSAAYNYKLNVLPSPPPPGAWMDYRIELVRFGGIFEWCDLGFAPRIEYLHSDSTLRLNDVIFDKIVANN